MFCSGTVELYLNDNEDLKLFLKDKLLKYEN